MAPQALDCQPPKALHYPYIVGGGREIREKNRTNYRKHGVRFEEAHTAFLDEDALLFDDPDHSRDEDGFILLGLSSLLRVLVVVHCLRDHGDAIRIISARKATKAEREAYRRGVS